MPILSQEIVDFLNRGGDSEVGQWLQENPGVGNFVTCPCISVRPTTIPRARRIVVYEDSGGRFVDIVYRNGSHRYIFNVPGEQVTVESIERLIHEVEAAGGQCHVERAFLVMQVPPGYRICFDDKSTGQISLQVEIHEDIGLQDEAADLPDNT